MNIFNITTLSIILCLFFPLSVSSKVACIGNEYEQKTVLSDTLPPSAKISNLPLIMVQGESIKLQAIPTVDEQNGGYPFFVWCTDVGSFEETTDSITNNYATVKFIAPNDGIKNEAKISILVGDTLGYINVTNITIPIELSTSTVNTDNDPSTGNITITNNSPDIDLSTQGTITLNGQAINATWTPDGVNFNLYEATNTTFDTFWHPVELEILDVNGQEIYSGCFPFKDVCGNNWYTRPIIKLWKEEIIQGYNEGKSATFGTFTSATRAEFIAALVRALEGDDYTPLTADPFTDVSKDDWHAPYIQYAKDIGLIQGCDQDKNLFCPNTPITREQAMKVLVLAYPHLKQLAEDYAQGKTPKKTYPDVDKTNQYYSYIYAAQAANVTHGYKDGTFDPSAKLKRAEMAKVICITKFGLMQCIDMGDSANKSLIFTASPYKAEINQMTTFSLYGINLPENMTLTIQDCANISQISGTEEKRDYQCTPTSVGSKQGIVTSATGEQLYTFTVQVEDIVDPIILPGTCTDSVVNNVTPTTATLNQLTTFTVYGNCLSAQTAFFIDECVDVKNVGGDEQQQQFTCTPSYKTGSHTGLVKDRSGGTELYNFSVNYLSTDEPTDPVDPPPSACNDISVSSVTPTTATLGQLTTFTVNGSCLSEQTAFFIGECIGTKGIGGNEQQRQFTCTPGYKTGAHGGLVKDYSGGTELHNFNVNFEWGTPKVTRVTPTTVQLNQVTNFMIEGSSLLDTTAIWIDGCTDLTVFDGDANNIGFQCKPTNSGTVSAVVKDKSGGNVLFDFTVTVQ